MTTHVKAAVVVEVAAIAGENHSHVKLTEWNDRRTIRRVIGLLVHHPTLVIFLAVAIASACRGAAAPTTAPSTDAPGSPDAINSDQALFRLVTVTQPFASYPRFPNVDVLRSGSSAHQPFVRVSMNATAFAALQNDLVRTFERRR